MVGRRHSLIPILSLLLAASSFAEQLQENDERAKNKMALWQRGLVLPDDLPDHLIDIHANLARRLSPVLQVRSGCSENYGCGDDFYLDIPRGGSENVMSVDERLKQLGQELGPEFRAAVARNLKEHAEDCMKSCESFYCADKTNFSNYTDDTEFVSFPFGPVPPEDFAGDFGFPLDLIKVSMAPLFPAEEAVDVVRIAESEGLSGNEYQSGKYKLGGDWLLNLPKTRDWFNDRLKNTLFPLLYNLFPEIISSPDVLRAHSVSLLKYNASHPRTDVHVDNGILAMTLAMTPMNEYQGGGTYFEHMGDEFVLPMDAGYGTFRPGSVRHGGHRVTEGNRYILGAFLLIEDRCEHVRRLKNRGSDLRKKGDFAGAIQHFEWALAVNPKCTTCLKDLGEIMNAKKNYAAAEKYVRQALELLEEKDSDALFTLGIVLSELGRDDESMEAYSKSLSINAEDAELCYNLGVKYGAKQDYAKERLMYEKAVQIEPTFSDALVNWGSSLAESGDLDAAEAKFIEAIAASTDTAPKAMINLGLVYNARANDLLNGGDIIGARAAAEEASKRLDDAKAWIYSDTKEKTRVKDKDQYVQQYKPLRLQVHRLAGRIMAAMSDFDACEKEFRAAVENFPNEAVAWDMLSRILKLQGKMEEFQQATEKINILRSMSGFSM